VGTPGNVSVTASSGSGVCDTTNSYTSAANDALSIRAVTTGTVGTPNTTISAIVGSGGQTGSGTANTMTKWTGVNVLGNATMTDNGTTVTLGSGKTLDVSAATVKYPPSLFEACAPVGNAADSTDTIGNNSVANSLQIFTAACGWSTNATANTIDGTHRGINITIIHNYTAPGSGATAVAEIGVCITANISAHTCTASYQRLWAGAAVAPAAAADQASLFSWQIIPTGTAGTFTTSSFRTNAGILNNPAANVSATVACSICANATAVPVSFVVGITWSTATGSTTCNGVANNGNNCASLTGASWNWF